MGGFSNLFFFFCFLNHSLIFVIHFNFNMLILFFLCFTVIFMHLVGLFYDFYNKKLLITIVYEMYNINKLALSTFKIFI